MKLTEYQLTGMTYTGSKKKTRCIGITGGVGSGKSSVLEHLKKTTGCRVFCSDEEAKKLYIPGSAVFDRIIKEAGRDVLNEDGNIDKEKFAAKLFGDSSLRERINAIVHPAVEEMIFDNMALERAAGKRDYFFVEAALLIECGYEAYLDELWYVYASEDTRRQRLKESRGYSDEKIQDIFDSQLSDKEYRKHCRRIIDNDGSPEEMRRSVDNIIKEEMYNK